MVISSTNELFEQVVFRCRGEAGDKARYVIGETAFEQTTYEVLCLTLTSSEVVRDLHHPL